MDVAFGVARYHADGSLDPTFDGDGVVTTDFGDSTQLWTRVNSLDSPWALDDLTTLVTEVGVRLPAHLTASGRAILAHLPAAQVRALYPDREAFVERNGTGPSSLSGLRAILAETRQRRPAPDGLDGQVADPAPHVEHGAVTDAGLLQATEQWACDPGHGPPLLGPLRPVVDPVVEAAIPLFLVHWPSVGFRPGARPEGVGWISNRFSPGDWATRATSSHPATRRPPAPAARTSTPHARPTAGAPGRPTSA